MRSSRLEDLPVETREDEVETEWHVGRDGGDQLAAEETFVKRLGLK